MRSESPLRGHSDWVRGVAFNPRDPQMLVSCSDDKTIKVWNITSGACLSTLRVHKYPVRSMCFSPCGTKIVSESWEQTMYGENGDFCIRVWDAKTGALIGSPLTGYSSLVTGVAFSADGQWIISGSADGTIRLWDAHPGGTAVPPA